MRFRKLRIAWSVVWGVAAVLLIVLWVRSYWQLDYVCRRDSKNMQTTISSQWGIIYFAHIDAQSPYKGTFNFLASHDWEYYTHESYVLDRPVWERDSDGFLINLPHWSFVLVLGLLAVVPSIPWFRFRFTLRTLLIATTLVAVVLRLIVYAASK